MDKEDVVYYYSAVIMEYSSEIKKNEILPFATPWMKLEGIMLSKISHQRKTIINDFTHMRTLRHRTDEHKGREAKRIKNQGRRQNIRYS